MKVCFLYRSKNVSYSIERVFNYIRKAMSDEISQSEFFCPANSYKNPFSYFKNFMALRREKADIYHITGVVFYLAMALPAKRTIITVHDLGHIFAKKGLAGFFLRMIFAHIPLRKAAHIVAISNFSKREIVEKVGISPEKISVIYNPVFDCFSPSSKKFNREKPIILCFAHMKNKNLSRHIMALKGLKCHLRIIGKLSREYTDELAESGLEYSNAYNLSGEQIVEEYKNCDFVLFASTYEGFGLPILEAQASGRPVVTSNIEPMSEVGGDAVVYVDPFKVESIREGVEKLLRTPDLPDKLVNLGFENLKRFSVDRICAQYEALYRRMYEFL